MDSFRTHVKKNIAHKANALTNYTKCANIEFVLMQTKYTLFLYFIYARTSILETCFFFQWHALDCVCEIAFIELSIDQYLIVESLKGDFEKNVQ